MPNWIIYGLVAIGATWVAFAIGRVIKQRVSEARFANAKKLFCRRREWLEAEFMTCAQRSGLPRGLEWTNCDFEDSITFARDLSNGQLRALVGVEISFAAVPGGGMEEVEAVGNLRFASAVFRYHQRRWQTDGRAIFNLRPEEAIQHFRDELRPVS